MAASFDLDAFREAHRPWSFRAGGFTHVARILSAAHILAFNVAVSDADEAVREGALAQLLRHAFPWRFSYRWRGDPVHRILSLEPAARLELLKSFFGWVRQTQGIALPDAPRTSGTPSSVPTPEPTP